MSPEELVAYNPKLVDYTPTTRLAYARFKTLGMMAKLREDIDETVTTTTTKATFNKERENNNSVKRCQFYFLLFITVNQIC
jgi:hypothetical protein